MITIPNSHILNCLDPGLRRDDSYWRKDMQYSPHLFRHLRFIIGQNIQKQRVKQKVPLKKLAQLSGIPEYLLEQYELGKNDPHLNELFRISCVLEVSMSDLMG